MLLHDTNGDRMAINKLLFIIFLITIDIVASSCESNDVVAFPQFASKQQKVKLERLTLKGSLEASNKIAEYYALVYADEGLYWEIVAAENGSIIAAHNVASFLSITASHNNDPYGGYRKQRQWYWLKIAADSGDKLALEEMKLLFQRPEEMYLESETKIAQIDLSKNSLPQIKRAAMLGSPLAAYKIFKYLTEVHAEQKDIMFWLRIAAQNGHPNAIKLLGARMSKSKNERDRLRSQFWLRKSVRRR